MDQTINRNTLRRLHIGGLSSEVTVDELKEKFNSFGTIQDVEIKTKKDVYGEDFNTFAYINIISDESALNKCFSIFNKAKWKGRSLQIHLAKEHFLKRLDEERNYPIVPVVKKVKTNFHNPLALLPEIEDFNMKGKVPGTPIPGEKKWVVGKYGRILPIVNVRNRSLNKDPSKYCHNLKKLKEEEESERVIDIEELTWKVETDTNNSSSKRRCGDFSEFESYVPKRVKLNEDYWSDEMQEKMEELRRRYLEKNSEEIPRKFEDDIEIVKSRKTVSSEYHIPKTDFIYDSDEQLSNDEEQFQHLSVLGEATTCGYDSAGSADTDEIIAMNASRNKTSSSNNSIANKEQNIPLKKPVVNEIDSKPKIDQVVTVNDKLTSNSELPLKTKQKIEIALSYVDNNMKQIPFQGIAMLDCLSIETVPKTTIKSAGDSESDTRPENENDEFDECNANNSYSSISKLQSSEIPNVEHSANDREYDSDDFEKVALKYSDSLSVLQESALRVEPDLKLEISKIDLQEKNISNKMLTASDSEDTDDMIKKIKNTEKTIKLIVSIENCSDETVTNIRQNNDTSIALKIPNEKEISSDSDLDSDDFEKVAEKYSSFVAKDTILNDHTKTIDVTIKKSETFKLNNDQRSSSESDIEILIKDRKVKSLNTPAKNLIKIQEETGGSILSYDTDDDNTVDDVSGNESDRNKNECNNRDKSKEESKDDARYGVKKTDKGRIASSDDESSNDDYSNSDEESDSDDQSDGEDASEANNGDTNKQGVEETDNSDSTESDDNDDSDNDGDDSDKDSDDSDKDSDDSDNESNENSDDDKEKDENEEDEGGDEDSKKEGDEEHACQKNKNFFVSSSLFSAFVKPEKDVNSGFSFLKTFGNQNISEPEKLELPKNLRKKEETECLREKSDEIEEKQITKSSTRFFFQPKDIRLQEGVQFFHRKMELDEIEDKWNEVKPVFLATCRQRNRLALKRLDHEKLKKRKISFTTSFMLKNRK